MLLDSVELTQEPCRGHTLFTASPSKAETIEINVTQHC